MSNLFQITDLYIPESIITNATWKKKITKDGSKRQKGFGEYDDIFYLEDPFDIHSLPSAIQIFEEKVVFSYSMEISKPLNWHVDDMILDEIAFCKYTCLIYGHGVLEIKDDEIYESYEFKEKFRIIKFNHKKLHRFVPYEKTKMLLIYLLEEKYINQYYYQKPLIVYNTNPNITY